jgi:ABC-type amino acid transport substrate-binding protein
VEKLTDRLASFPRHPAIKLAAVIGSITVVSLGLIASIPDLRSAFNSLGGFTVFLLAIGTMVLVILLFVIGSMRGDRQIRQMSADLEKSQSGLLPPDTYQRYEDIENREISLGWIPFHPTLKVDAGTGDKYGPGHAILTAVFDGHMKYYKKEGDWSDIIRGLNQHQFDVVATPLYDIKERREHVEFTTPIFYADIGIFVAKQNRKVHAALGNKLDLDFPFVKDKLSEIADSLTLCVHEGELQDKMTTKYLKGAKIKRTKMDKFSVPAALDAMIDEDEEYDSDLYFCERLQGESHRKFRSELVNILAPGQLLFPVAFAVRRGDDTLRKFINLRLMSIDEEIQGGIQALLTESVKGIISDSLMSKAGEYFLRYRPPQRRDESEKVVPIRG